MARPPAPRTLPYLYWGIHPLYFANVRMLAAHVNHCLDGTEPGRTDAHILYGHHPITKCVASAPLVASARVSSRDDSRTDTAAGLRPPVAAGSRSAAWWSTRRPAPSGAC